jgi:hypothetical protein
MSEIDTPPSEVKAMRKLMLTGIAALVLAVLAAPAGAAPTTLVVAMKDPGCHWFSTGHKYVKTVVRTGPVTLVNHDEAALIVKGSGMTRKDAVGAKLTLKTKGVYTITMVKQASDDNTLKLTIK